MRYHVELLSSAYLSNAEYCTVEQQGRQWANLITYLTCLDTDLLVSAMPHLLHI